MNKTYIPALLILILVFILHYLGMYQYLYVRINGYDIMMHILGGAGIAISLYWMIVTWTKTLSDKKIFWLTFFGTIIIGLLWEFMEGFYGITGEPLWSYLYWVDTIKDLINDTLGMLIIFFILKRQKHVS